MFELTARIKTATDLHRAQRYEDAIRMYRQILRQSPNQPKVLHLLGTAMLEAGHPEDAISFIEKAISLSPMDADYHSDLGAAYEKCGRIDAALSAIRTALRLKPSSLAARHNLVTVVYQSGMALLADGRDAVAIEHFREAIKINPEDAEIRARLGEALLRIGEFSEGWVEHEWRFRTADFAPMQRTYRAPRWNGEPLAGKRIFIRPEQGLGDFIHFLRFVPLVKALGAIVLLGVYKDLLALLKDFEGADQIIGSGQRLPSFDYHCPLLSLPLALGTRLESIPDSVPYLKADPTRISRWAKRLATPMYRVGLVWAGRPDYWDDRNRSPRLEPFMPLLEIPGVQYFGLQLGDGHRDLDNQHLPRNFVDLAPDIDDFADTAAIMMNLDLVVSSCTAPIHLAGALGRPVWVVLPILADWRWLRERDDSPWYPTMRLFRQRVMGDWREVFDRVGTALVSRIAQASESV